MSLTGHIIAVDGDWAMWCESDVELVLHEVFDGMDPNTESLIFSDPAYKGAYGVTSYLFDNHIERLQIKSTVSTLQCRLYVL